MRVDSSLLFRIGLLIISVLANEEKVEIGEKKLFEEVEHFIEEPAALKDGPVKIEVVGDTSHLFADEDFEKKEVVLLYDSNKSNETDEKKLNVEDQLRSSSELNEKDAGKNNSQTKTGRAECLKSNLTLRANNSVQIVNGSRLSQLLSEKKENECFLVLFYVPWCPFSTKLAPIYNAVPRAFLNLDILAFDISKSIGYNTKFGTSAVPMILLFQQRNILAKFNYTRKNLNDYIEFLANMTGFSPNRTIDIEVQDFEGPVPTVVEKRFDYYLLISWLFIIFVSIDMTIRKTQFKRYIIRMIRYLANLERVLQLPRPPQRPMLQEQPNQQQQQHHPHNE